MWSVLQSDNFDCRIVFWQHQYICHVSQPFFFFPSKFSCRTWRGSVLVCSCSQVSDSTLLFLLVFKQVQEIIINKYWSTQDAWYLRDLNSYSMSSSLCVPFHRPPVFTCGCEECCVWNLRTARFPALGGSHLSADAWSQQQSECSAAVSICSTTGR